MSKRYRHCQSDACLCIDDMGYCECTCPECRAADEVQAEALELAELAGEVDGD